MSLLSEIQEAAIDAKGGIAPLLRRCHVLAYRLENDELKTWVQHELNGYPDEEPLPSYRRLSLSLTGTFLGSFGSALRGVPIVPAALPKQLADLVRDHPLRSPISEYEALAESGKDIQIQLSGNAILAIGHNVYQKDYSCVEARHVMPDAFLRGLVDAVRNRVLSFALELGKLKLGNVDDAVIQRDIPQAAVSQVFHTHIIGNHATVAVGDGAHAQAVGTVIAKDFESLAKFLAAHRVDEADVTELKAALAADTVPASESALGARVSLWIGKMASKAVSGAWKVGVDVGTKLLTTAIEKYYGLS